MAGKERLVANACRLSTAWLWRGPEELVQILGNVPENRPWPWHLWPWRFGPVPHCCFFGSWWWRQDPQKEWHHGHLPAVLSRSWFWWKAGVGGHSFTTRFVVSTIPKTKYESDGEVFNVATEHLAKSLRQCLDKGYVDHARGGEHFRIAILGIKGDAPFLAKVGHFFRSYNTTAKRGEQRGAPKGVCPYCLAGTDNFPAEEIATSTPKWQSAVGVKPPWVRVPALVRHLPHNPGDPSAFYKSDIWHVVHLGFGRSWVASVLQLCLQFLEHPNLDEKWSHITEEYLTWCRQNRKQAHISKVTPYLMSYGDSAGAMGNWHKGALTCNFCTWLVEFLGKVPKARDVHGWLTWCRSSTYRLNSMFGVLYKAGAFLNSHEASFVSEQGLEFLRCYASMAQAMFSGGRQWLFPLYPKLHVFHHLLLEVRNVGASKGACINPLMFGCQMDEDTIGRCARLSRRVSIRRVSGRTLDRYLVCARAAFVNGGILKWEKVLGFSDLGQENGCAR